MLKILLLLLFCSSAWAANLPQALPVPGGIIEIPLTESENPPKVYYYDRRVLVTRQGDGWLAIVGIPLSAKPGTDKIHVVEADRQYDISFQIANKDYPEQRLIIKKKRMVTGFTKEDLAKIKADKIEMAKAKAVWSEAPAALDFLTPVDGRLSSRFGLKRFFNDIPKRPHNGLDIAAPTGTPILAPTTAKVINTGHYYFNGNTVFLDHGQGLLSAYLHMNKISVKPGDIVEQGQQIGTVGSTGRVTGPHLHWIVYLNKTPVDPALFIADDIARLDARNKNR